GHKREHGVAPEDARAVAEILPDRFEPAERVHRVDLFADTSGVAEFSMGGGGGVLPRHAARKVVVGFLREVRVELARALLVPVAATEKAREQHGDLLLRGGPEDAVDGADDLVPARGLRLELLAALRREAVVPRFAVVLGRAPERRDPAAVLEAVER